MDVNSSVEDIRIFSKVKRHGLHYTLLLKQP